MQDGAEIVGYVIGFVCALTFMLMIWLGIGTLMYRRSLHLYNKLAAGKPPVPDAMVPIPSWGKSLGIMAIIFVINFAVNLVLMLLMGVELGGRPNNVQPELQPLQAVINLISTAVMMGLIFFVSHKMLPTSMDRAMLVSLIFMTLFFVLIIAIVFAVIFLAIVLSAAR